jgi:hypothetical protein
MKKAKKAIQILTKVCYNGYRKWEKINHHNEQGIIEGGRSTNAEN